MHAAEVDLCAVVLAQVLRRCRNLPAVTDNMPVPLPGILATTPWACGRLKQQQTSAVTPLHRLRMCVPLCPASMYLPLTGCSLLVTGGERSTRCDARNLPVTNDG
jgi:hypothetical protein